MDRETLKNWKRIEEALRKAGKLDCMFYKRAVAIVAGRPDPLK
jgi:hypothetical protein